MTEQAKTEAPFAEVLSAVSKAMGAIKKVAKEGKNTHDNYKFASIDDFLAMVGPICSDSGLIFHMEEGETEDFTRKGKYGESAWMRMHFHITVYHTSGQSMPPVTRSVEVLRNGAQAYGSAQSYALKQFLRCLFLIPTGDKDDADYRETGDGTIERKVSSPVETPSRIGADQYLALKARMEEAGVTDDQITGRYGVANIEDLPVEAFQKAMTGLQKTIDGKKPPVEDEITY